MGIRLALRHRTRYDYDRVVRLGPQSVRLRPAPHCRASVSSYSFHALPEGHSLHWLQDPWGNHVARLLFPDPVERLELAVDLVVDLAPINPFDFYLEPEAARYPFRYPAELRRPLEPCLESPSWGPRFERLVEEIDRSPRGTVEFVVELNRRLHGELDFLKRLEPGLQSPEETLERGRGACRDFAWLEVQVLRRLGLAARFVSGYSIQLVPDVERDTVDLHAWSEVYLPGAGWVGLDATSGLLAGEGHIPLACASDPAAAAPLTGTVGPCEVEFAVELGVTRVREAP